jgi:hypothetical protein
VGNIKTDMIYPRRGLKQGCGLSPILFSIYIMDLGSCLKKEQCGVSLGNVMLNSLLFADDLLIGSTEQELGHLLQTLQSWCKDYRMNISELKSKVVSESDLEVWEVLSPKFEYVCCVEQLHYSKYLGIDIHPTLAKIRKGKSDKMSRIAGSFAKSILMKTKTEAD